MQEKIESSLDEIELAELIRLLEKSNIKDLNDLIKLINPADDQDAFIQQKVFASLADLSGFPIDSIQNDQNLKFDLGLTNYHKKSLKTYFQRIVIDMSSDKKVTVSECTNCHIVSDCIDLVNSKV